MERKNTRRPEGMVQRYAHQERNQSDSDEMEEFNKFLGLYRSGYQELSAYIAHLGGNVYCSVTEGNPCVDIRQYWRPEEEVVPTKKGLCL